jgi:hypothetical protein
MATKLKREPTEWEKILVSYLSERELIIIICREIKTQNLTSQRINNPLNKWENECKRQFSKEKMQVSNKHMRKCSTSLAIKKGKSKQH